MKQLKTYHLIILAIALILVSVVVTRYWQARYYPYHPLFVEILNSTNSTIPSVIIEHGNDQLQEKITLVQLRPEEKRIIALNHQSGLGFNVQVNYANGEMTEICAGKSKGFWFYRETILDVGIYTTPLY
ncbi:MAG: hypothetical protein KAG28_02775 [Cocleimonas sp.]|nr:hypothetical protein [Cocleimonas sp.]